VTAAGFCRTAAVAAAALTCGTASASAPLVQGTGVPWLNEKPSTGTAIWPEASGTYLGPLATLRVAVIRVEFVEDYTPSTTGDGSFDLDASPPHDRDYTVSLCDDMAAYFQDVSGGRMVLECTVFPVVSGAYTLPHQMAWYGADSTWVTGVCMLLRDAVEAADADVDFSSFGAVLVVHAGAGQEADVGQNSPDDISSVFLTLADLAYYLPEGGYGYLGIETNDGVYVQEGSVVPEQETQDGFGLGVLGTMVHEILHQLGLPDLYDTLTGGVGVGGWDIMGYGQWLMSGFWPPAPGAWSRADLGWADVVTVEGGTWESALGDTVLRIRLTGSEYILVENRQRDPDGDGLCDSSERDYGLAGSGVVIWHIDSGVLDANRAGNTVNTDPAHKGVDVEEADGIQDFDYSLPDLYGYEGSVYDPWFQGGYGYLFDATSTPSTETSWGGLTGVSVEVQDPPSNSMTLEVASGLMAPGWPPPSIGATRYGPVPAVLSIGASILLTSPQGVVWAMPLTDPVPQGFFEDAACAPLVDDFPGIGQAILVCTGNASVHLLDPSGYDLPGWPVVLPAGSAVSSLLSGRAGFVAIATERNRIFLYSSDGDLLQGWPRTVSEQVTGMAVVPGSEGNALAALTRSGGLYAWGSDGLPLGGDWPTGAQGGEPTGSPLCTDFDRDGDYEIAALCGSTLNIFDRKGRLLPGLPSALRGTPFGSPWMADLNEDGYPEILTETSEGVEAFEASGAVLLDWPLLPPIDGSAGEYELWNSGTGGVGFTAFSLRDGRTGLADQSGGMMSGFPVSTGDDPVGRPVLYDSDGDGSLELIAADASGWAGLWQTQLPAGSGFPGSDFSGQNCWWIEDMPEASPGQGLLAEGSFFVYPNPVRTDYGNIRFEPGEESTYEIRVFDIAGELVAEFEGDCSAGMACELQWSVEDLSPGLYFVCLELRGQAGETQALFEAGVVH
jgi:M6 family metalloprotease-like protein